MKYILVCAGILALVISPPANADTVVRYDTVIGSFFVGLYNDVAPVTVANFLNYVRDGDYVDSIFHRSAWIDNSPDPPTPFVVQGGGFTVLGIEADPGWTLYDVPVDGPIVNEFSLSNVRGTIAMAKQGGDPNSATSQWFFNLSDNSANLDSQNGGFTVFGAVLSDGMQILDAISQVTRFEYEGAFGELPLRGFTQEEYEAGLLPDLDDFIHVLNIVPMGDANADGAVDATDIQALAANYGLSVSGPLSWQSGDFGGNGIIDIGDLGILAFMCYYSAGGGGGRQAPAAVPEPASMSLLLLGASVLLRRAKR